MTHPYLLAAMSSFDTKGRLVVFAIAGQMLGLAIGPGVAAGMVGEGDFSGVLWMGIGVCIASYVVLLPALLKQRSMAAALQAA